MIENNTEEVTEEQILEMEEFFSHYTILAGLLYGKDSIDFENLRYFFQLNLTINNEIDNMCEEEDYEQIY